MGDLGAWAQEGLPEAANPRASSWLLGQTEGRTPNQPAASPRLTEQCSPGDHYQSAVANARCNESRCLSPLTSDRVSSSLRLLWCEERASNPGRGFPQVLGSPVSGIHKTPITRLPERRPPEVASDKGCLRFL